MGRGIAQLAAQAGCRVLLLDAQPGAAEGARSAVVAHWQQSQARERISAEQASAWTAQLQAVDSLAALAGCDLVIEAIVERPDAKQALFTELEALLPAQAVLASNTSSLSVTALADQPMVGIAVHDALGRMLQGHLSQVVPAPRTAVWVQTYQLAYSLVAQGEGLALVDPFTAAWGGGKTVQTRPLKLQLDVVLYALYRLDSPLNPLQKRFLGLVRQLAQQMLGQA